MSIQKKKQADNALQAVNLERKLARELHIEAIRRGTHLKTLLAEAVRVYLAQVKRRKVAA